jgi:ATP-dependent helicase HrpB
LLTTKNCNVIADTSSSSTHALPIHAVLNDIVQALGARNELVLEAPPGAGKTTVVPLALLDQEWLNSQEILVLEPRRIAARAAAERMAEILGEPLGKRVGYRIRQDVKVSSETRITVVTEGILTRRLQHDPTLEGVGLVIFDEFHERNLDSDLGLALCLQGRALFREEHTPLKLLVMSATLDGKAVAHYLNKAPLIRSEGRAYPVELVYGKPYKIGEPIVEATVTTVLAALHQYAGSVLVFLPGQSEIRRVLEKLIPQLPSDVLALPLHGSLPFEAQQKAIRPLAEHSSSHPQNETLGTPRYTRKVVLSTDIAETSLTIEGVNVVIDSGLARVPTFDLSSGLTRLHTQQISKSSSTQRAGRAGRLAPGVCYRLWSESQQQQLVEHAAAEILNADLAPLALQLLQWGVDDVKQLSWLDPPSDGAFQQALTLLKGLNATVTSPSNSTQLSPHGERMANLPTHPRLAHMLLVACEYGLEQQASRIAAFLAERDPFGYTGADFTQRMAFLAGKTSVPKAQQNWLTRTKKQVQSFTRLTAPFAKVSRQAVPFNDDEAYAFLLCCAYPDRIARRRNNTISTYKLSNARSAIMSEAEPLCNNEWLVVAALGGQRGAASDRIYCALALSPTLFESALFDKHIGHIKRSEETVEWDTKADRCVAERRSYLGEILLAKQPIRNCAPELRSEAIAQHIAKQGLNILPWNSECRQWQARVELLRKLDRANTETPWPDVSNEGLCKTMGIWLHPYLDSVITGNDIRQLPLLSILSSLLSWPQSQRLDELAPQKFAVPSGSHIIIDYCQTPPVLAVKLQEMFGSESTPTVVAGKQALMVHLLSPARRPLQITQDLSGFWRSSYNEVKKEMKGRYPRHPWPDNPLESTATRFTKHRHRQ